MTHLIPEIFTDKGDRLWGSVARAAYLKDKVCCDCGGTKKLEFHHLDPESKRGNVRFWKSEAWLVEEIAKCVILCNSCHWKRHGSKHGTPAMYTNHHCRCDSCRESWNRCMKEYQTRRRTTGSGKMNPDERRGRRATSNRKGVREVEPLTPTDTFSGKAPAIQ